MRTLTERNLEDFIDGCIYTIIQSKNLKSFDVKEYLDTEDSELLLIGLELAANELYDNNEEEKSFFKDNFMQIKFGRVKESWPFQIYSNQSSYVNAKSPSSISS